MKRHSITSIALATALSCAIGMTLAAQDLLTLKSPNGIAFSEFKGYDAWQTIAPSVTDDGLKSILGNPVMIKAYQDGATANGKPVPDGAMMVKIEWAKKANAASPYSVMEPESLSSVSFMMKDAKRFPDTDGWGYAQYKRDPATKTFKVTGNGAAFTKAACHTCHTRVKARDFVFTSYAKR